MATKLNKLEASSLINKYVRLPKIGKSINAKRLEIIADLLNEDGEAILQDVIDNVFNDSSNPLNALSITAKNIEKKARETGFQLIIARDNYKKAKLKDRILWIEGDNEKKEKVINSSYDSLIQPESSIISNAKLLNRKTLIYCYAIKDKKEFIELKNYLEDSINLKDKETKYEFINYREIPPGNDRESYIDGQFNKADIILAFESPSFYSDSEINKYFIHNNNLTKSRFCCIGLKQLGAEPDRRICNGLQLFLLEKNENVVKYYNELAGSSKLEFADSLAIKILDKLGEIEGSLSTQQEIFRNEQSQRISKLEEIKLDHPNYIENLATVENLGKFTPRNLIQPSNNGINVLSLLDDWVSSDNSPTLFALLGQYGMGKTFTSKIFAKLMIEKYKANQSKYLTIYFDLRDLDHRILNSPQFNVWKIIDNILYKRKGAEVDNSSLNAEYIQEIWKSENTLFIFDGLDEVTAHIGNPNLEAFFIQELFKLVPEYRSKINKKTSSQPKRKMLLTCRTDYFKSITAQSSYFQLQNRQHIDSVNDYECAILLPFNVEQIKAYFRQVFKNKDAEVLYRTLLEIHNLAELSSRPVLLSFITEIIEDIEGIVKNGGRVTTAQIYDRIVNKSFDRDLAKHEIPVEIKLRVLEEIAALLWKSSNRRIEFSILAEFLSEYLANGSASMKKLYYKKEEEALYKDLRNATLLVRSNERDFGFSHTSVQEYFLAKFLITKIETLEFNEIRLQNTNKETFDFLQDLLSEFDNEKLKFFNKCFSAGFREENPEIRAFLLQIYITDQNREHLLQKPDYFNLSELELKNLKFTGTKVNPIDLSNSILSNSILNMCHWRNVNLEHANLTCCNMYMCNFENVNLEKANLSGAKLRGKFRYVSAQTAITNSQTTLEFLEISKSKLWKNSDAKKDLVLQTKNFELKVISNDFGSVNHFEILSHNRVLFCCSSGSLYLWDIANGRVINELKKHTGSVTCCAVLEGERALSSSNDGSLILWDLTQGKVLHQLKKHTSSVHYFSILNGDQALSCSRDGSLILWDLTKGTILKEFYGHSKTVNFCTILKKERALSCSDDGKIIFWNLRDGKVIKTLAARNPVTSYIIINHEKVLSGSVDGTLTLWNLKTGSLIEVMYGGSEVTYIVALDNERALSCHNNGNILLWDLNHGIVSQRFEQHKRKVNYCTVLNEGQMLSCSDDSSLILWDLVNGNLLQRYYEHTDKVKQCFAFKGLNRSLSSSDDGSLILWELDSGKVLLKIQKHATTTTNCKTFLGDKTLCTSKEGTLTLWDLKKSKVIQVVKNDISFINYSLIMKNDRALTCHENGSLIMWDMKTGKTLKELKKNSYGITYCVLLENEKVLACSEDGDLRLWDLTKEKVVQEFKRHTRTITYCTVLSQEKAITCSKDGSLTVWNLTNGKVQKILKKHTNWVVYCKALDNERVLSCSWDKSLILWEVKTGTILQEFNKHSSRVTYCAILANERAISCSDDGTLILWDLKTGKLLKHLKKHSGSVTHCAVLSNHQVLSSSQDKTLILWDLKSGKAIFELKKHNSPVIYCTILTGNKALSCSEDGIMIIWDLANGEALRTHYHLLDNGYASINKTGSLLDYSSNAWEHLQWVKETDKGREVYHFDEVILEDD